MVVVYALVGFSCSRPSRQIQGSSNRTANEGLLYGKWAEPAINPSLAKEQL